MVISKKNLPGVLCAFWIPYLHISIDELDIIQDTGVVRNGSSQTSVGLP